MTSTNLKPMFRTRDGRSLLAGVLPVALFASGQCVGGSRTQQP